MADSTKKSMELSSITNITLMATCFLAGIYVGRKLSNAARRVSSLISVGPSKLALVVRNDLKMGRGKIASQCSHGTVAAYLKMQKSNPKLLQAWLDSGQAKVVLKAADLNQLLELSEASKSYGVQEVLVMDAGRTQVAQGSETVLAVGPGSVKDVDKITGKLQLL
ncbi:peptidyl-tRNA hydrolase 2, mitochondrial-like [Palaemon carinicauda]|uniref:peptidyl-tRNA hydrolase 2, mitochondrial-like n=1 Tax=Palaemon carinicauda TaxID=392227 RepID=UPI0035B5EAA0